MKYLLDTNVISELRKVGDGKADANVVAWIGAEDAARFFISAIPCGGVGYSVFSADQIDGLPSRYYAIESEHRG